MNEKDKPANIPRSGLDAHQNKRADFYEKNIKKRFSAANGGQL